MVLLVFSTNRAHALDLYFVFMSRTHFKQSVGGVRQFPKFWQVKVLNLPNQNPNSKPRHVWRKKVTSPLKASSQESLSLEQTEVLINFTRRSTVRRTYNTEPSPKKLAWGEAPPCIQVSILIKVSILSLFSFSFFLNS